MNKILVAMSGGVDSATAAALLIEQGFAVAGATMILKDTKGQEVDLARRCCELLGIEFFIFDFTEIFQQEVLDDFVNEYKAGRTPNPCVICNQLIKFGAFLQRANELGFEKMATGHYARAEREKDHFLLRRGRDRNEQSYFLYRLSQEQLASTILPLGGYTKDEVRKTAIRLRLPTARRKKSQDICFLPEGDYCRYLSGILPENPGPIFDGSGRKIGTHKGVVFYTYGQRRGMGISHKRPYYVTKIDAEENAIYVGEKEDVYQRGLIAADIHFTYSFEFHGPLKVKAKPRYFAPLSAAAIEPYPLPKSAGVLIKKVKVIFDKPQWALTPGQSVVFYKGRVVLGGGVIDQILGSNLHT